MKRMFSSHAQAAILALTCSAFLTSCTTNPYTGEQELSKTAMGAALAGLAGAGIGALSGDNSKERRDRALIGAGIGALAGGAVGAYMDNQEAKLRRELQATGVSVTRRGDQIILNMPGNVTFATNSASITGNFYRVLDSVGRVLSEYDRTTIDVAGHTDSTGSRAHNMQLSEARAVSVADYLRDRAGIAPMRFYVQGYGPDYPIADNGSSAGRQQNRRVEISIRPIQ